MIGIENRLSLISPELSSELLSLSDEGLRKVALEVSSYAIEQTELKDPIVGESLKALSRGNVGDLELLERLEEFVYKLDLIQWELQIMWEEDKVDEEEYIAAFRRARAANALYFALYSDNQVAAVESAYESIAAIDDLKKIKQIISNEFKKDK